MKNFRDDEGFTLVELAIVMVIIGLLIGGILKGQEMIENARVNATISQIKAIDAASSTFQDMYDALAGDMSDAATRLQGAPANGNGNNRLDVAPLAAQAVASEGAYFFDHLAAADLLSGSRATTGIDANIRGAEITVGQLTTSGNLGLSTTARSGRYATVAVAADPTSPGLTQLQAGRIDRKLDDGSATTGSVIASGGAGATAADCANGNAYNESFDTVSCSIAARVN